MGSMAPWGNPDAYTKAKCDDGKSYTFTAYSNQTSVTGFTKGYVNVSHNGKWKKIPGLYNPETNEFAADRRSKWAFLLVPELATEETVPAFSETEAKSIFGVPLAEEYKVEKLGPPSREDLESLVVRPKD